MTTDDSGGGGRRCGGTRDETRRDEHATTCGCKVRNVAFGKKETEELGGALLLGRAERGAL